MRKKSAARQDGLCNITLQGDNLDALIGPCHHKTVKSCCEAAMTTIGPLCRSVNSNLLQCRSTAVQPRRTPTAEIRVLGFSCRGRYWQHSACELRRGLWTTQQRARVRNPVGQDDIKHDR